jgi:hypothetical protein
MEAGIRIDHDVPELVVIDALGDIPGDCINYEARHSGLTVASGARTGAVTLIQRFGSALTLYSVPPVEEVPNSPLLAHVVLEPLDFIARLAALVPRPRLNLTRFHRIFAPNFKHRKRVVPHRSRSVFDSDKPPAPMSWMQRLKRVFAIDIETCPECGGKPTLSFGY